MPRTLILVCCLWLAGAAVPATAQSDPILKAQQRLEAAGFNPGPADGVMGSQTRKAVEEFQRRNALPITGELDWQTQMALSASVRSMPDSAPPPPRAAPVPGVVVGELPAPGTAEAAVAVPAPASGAGGAEPAVSAAPSPIRLMASPAPERWDYGSTPYWLAAAGLAGLLLGLWGWTRLRRTAEAEAAVTRRRDIARSGGAGHFPERPADRRPVTTPKEPG